MEVKKLLDRKEPVKKSDYLEVAEIEVNGERFRKVLRFAGTGKMRRELPAVYERFNPETNRWERL